jgi:hypothetical protein
MPVNMRPCVIRIQATPKYETLTFGIFDTILWVLAFAILI